MQSFSSGTVITKLIASLAPGSAEGQLRKATRKSQCREVVCAVLVAFIFLTASSSGQQINGSGQNVDPSNALGPTGPNKPSDIWDIDPHTGAVHIRIPIGTMPSGGRGPKAQPIFQYNSSSTTNLLVQSATAGAAGNNVPIVVFSVSWSAPQYGSTKTQATPPSGPWVFTYGPSFFYGFTDYTYPVNPDGDGFTSGSGVGTTCRTIAPVVLADQNGDIHDLGLDVTYAFDQEENPNCSGGVITSAVTMDGSDIASSISGFTPESSTNGILSPPTTPGTLNPVLLPDGTQIQSMAPVLSSMFYNTPINASIEDANGNLFTAGGQDSEGRDISMSGLTMGSSDISSGSYTLTTRGDKNSSENYNITVSPFVYAGNYTMPHPTQSEISISPGSDFYGGLSIDTTPGRGAANEISSISLPNNTSYFFTYDPNYGTISSITFPTGGHVRFGWGVRGVGTSSGGPAMSVAKQSTLVATDVWVSDSVGTANEKHWQYQYQDMLTTPYYSSGAGTLTSTETAPDGTKTVFTSAPFLYASTSPNIQYSYQEILRQIISSSGNPIMTVATSYGSSNLQSISGIKPVQEAITYFQSTGAIQRLINHSYDGAWNETERDESAFYPCQSSCAPPANPPVGWLRKTMTSFLWSNPNPTQPTFAKSYLLANIVHKPSQVTITDGFDNVLSQAQYNYDETALSGSAGILNHDDVNYPASMIGPRGNLTTEKRCATISGNSCTTWISKTTSYDLTGMPITTTDFNGNPTTYSYSDAYASGGPSVQTNSYPTTVTTVASPWIEKYSFNYYTGSVASHTDWNGNTTNYSYADTMNRPTSIVSPATYGNGVTSFAYNDIPGGSSVTKSILENTSGQQFSHIISFDGLGRTIHTQDVAGSLVVANQDTTYDAVGRVYSVTNPYLTLTDSSYGIETNSYDALNRLSQVQHSDGSAKLWCYDGISTSSSGAAACGSNLTPTSSTWVDSLDEVGNHIQRVSDAFGRLITVMEPNPDANSSYLETDYGYDSLGNLISVRQEGLSSDSPRTRIFKYDSLSRLISSQNPEAGLLTYSYTNGIALCAGDPSLLCSKTDSRGITTKYRYDALNRTTQRTFPIVNFSGVSSNQFQSNCYQYDTMSGAPSSANLIGHLVAEWTQRGSTAGTCDQSYTPSDAITAKVMLTYDAMGRPLLSQQCVSTMCTTNPFSQSQMYDLAGNMTSWMDGRGYMTFTQGFDSASRPASLTNSVNGSGLPSVLFSVQGYTPAGALQNWNIGDFLNVMRSYDSRFRITKETVNH